MSHNIV